MAETADKELVRSEDGRFLPGKSGNPDGRPKGSKNKITIMKIAAESSVREDNFDKMLEVCSQIIQAALDGDKQARKLVWESMMTKGVSDEAAKSGGKPQINLNFTSEAPTLTVEGTTHEHEEADE